MGQEKKFYTGTLTLNYYEGEPNGPKMLLLPGLGTGIITLRVLLPYLEDNYHIFILEYRGRGKSDRSNDYSLAAFTDDTRQFIKKIIKGPVIIYGHSMGGRIILQLLKEFRDIIQCPIIGDIFYENTTYEELSIQEGFEEELKKHHQIKNLFEKNISLEEKKEQLIGIMGEIHRERYNQYAETDFWDATIFGYRLTKEGWEAWLKGSRKEDVKGYLQYYQKPMLFIFSKSTLEYIKKLNGMEWDKDLREMTNNRANVKMKIVELSHGLQWEDPELIANEIKEFLAEYLDR